MLITFESKTGEVRQLSGVYGETHTSNAILLSNGKRSPPPLVGDHSTTWRFVRATWSRRYRQSIVERSATIVLNDGVLVSRFSPTNSRSLGSR